MPIIPPLQRLRQENSKYSLELQDYCNESLAQKKEYDKIDMVKLYLKEK
jgi:hypothetical protein